VTPRRRQKLSLIEMMTLVLGFAIGFGILVGLRVSGGAGFDPGALLVRWTFVLGGLSLVGVPLLLAERWRRRRGLRLPWGAGKTLWFATGTATWLMWPPIVYKRATRGELGESTASICFAYGTPLMALYVALALLAGGWFRKSRRRRYTRRSWREAFGLLLGLLWAISGLYVLFLIYKDDFD
jgi:hypothetical protein